MYKNSAIPPLTGENPPQSKAEYKMKCLPQSVALEFAQLQEAGVSSSFPLLDEDYLTPSKHSSFAGQLPLD